MWAIYFHPGWFATVDRPSTVPSKSSQITRSPTGSGVTPSAPSRHSRRERSICPASGPGRLTVQAAGFRSGAGIGRGRPGAIVSWHFFEPDGICSVALRHHLVPVPPGRDLAWPAFIVLTIDQ